MSLPPIPGWPLRCRSSHKNMVLTIGSRPPPPETSLPKLEHSLHTFLPLFFQLLSTFPFSSYRYDPPPPYATVISIFLRLSSVLAIFPLPALNYPRLFCEKFAPATPNFFLGFLSLFLLSSPRHFSPLFYSRHQFFRFFLI